MVARGVNRLLGPRWIGGGPPADPTMPRGRSSFEHTFGGCHRTSGNGTADPSDQGSAATQVRTERHDSRRA